MFVRSLAAALVTALALLGTASSQAARLIDRSPFAQGHWWDPSRSGSGFEIFNVGEQAMVIWYTFDTAGNPVWYTAQGTLVEPLWPLLKHRWVNGQRGAFEVVGSLRLGLRNPESIDVSFTFGTQADTWRLQPFNVAGVVNEVDRSGSYFNPQNSGWGLTLQQQGDMLGGILYSYDASGAPVWYAGFDRPAATAVNLVAARGACPVCTYAAPTTRSVGRISFDYESEWALVLRSQVTEPMAAGVNLDGARIVQLGRPASSRVADRELAAFTADDVLKRYLDDGMMALPASISYGTDFSPAPAAGAATAFSTTNLQESGVDEADLVKTDGTLVYTFATGQYGATEPMLRVAQVSAQGGNITVLGTVPLAGPNTTAQGGSAMDNAGLYLHDGQLVSVTGTRAYGYSPWSLWAYSTMWRDGVTNIQIFQTSATALPVSVWHAHIDGHIVSSRRIGNRLYVVARHVPQVANFQYGVASAAAQNRATLAATPLASMLPNVRLNGSSARPLLDATSVSLPPLGARPPQADFVMIYAIDLSTRTIAQSLAVLGGAETVYASTDNLYVATTRYQYRTAAGGLLPVPPFFTTDIHQIRLGGTSMSVVASATVEGSLGFNPDMAAFRLSEHLGKLRVVTSENSMWGGERKNRLTILEPSAVVSGLLKTVSYLPNAQRPETLGKPGELLYSTRFLADRLYAVTFKNIDPLYVVDISNADDPKIAGALEVPGFSQYLHPLPNGLLLGFGKDAKPADVSGDGTFAWYQGLQLSLFDVSNASQPREIKRLVLGKRGSSSPLLGNHKAFSSLTRADGSLLIAIPARLHGGDTPMYGSGDSAMYPWQESGLLRFEVRGTTPATAELVQAPALIVGNSTAYTFTFDPTVTGRSILFPGSAILVGNGRFWRQDHAGGSVSGPF